MAKFISEVLVVGQDDFVSSATAMHKVGTRAVSDDGRVFRYVKAGAVDLVAGNVLQGPAIVANHLGATAPAVAVGATSFSFTPGATLGTADQYADGFMQVDTTPGLGYTYGVVGHAAFASATAFTIYLKDPIQVALTTSSRLGLHQNKYKGVIQSPITTATGLIVGVATYIITASQFGWVQTWGQCATLVSGTPALGATVIGTSATAAGSVDVATAVTILTGQIVGKMGQVGVSGKSNIVDLAINP